MLSPKSYTSFSGFATLPGRHLVGGMDQFYVWSYYYTQISYIHTYTSDHMHQVVGGSVWSTIDAALLYTATNEEYIKFWVPLTHSTKALKTTSNA